MPTLVDFPSAETSSFGNREHDHEDDDASETMIFEDAGSGWSRSRQARLGVDIDESTMLLSPDTEKDGYNKSLNSLLDHMNSMNDNSILLTKPESKMADARSHPEMNDKENERSFHNTSERVQTRAEHVHKLPHCPSRDSYQNNYSTFVRQTISNFEAQHPGQLQDYRQMSADDKQDAQDNLMALLGRLGIGKGKNGGNESSVGRASDLKQDGTMDHNDSTVLDAGRSPRFDPDETVLTVSPATKSNREVSFHQDVHFEKQHRSRNGNCSEVVDKSAMLLSSHGDVDKSAILLSPQGFHPDATEHVNQDSDHSFGVQNDGMDDSIQDSVEVPRQARASSPENLCYDSPEHKRTNPHKRLASSSGKRGADMSRQRLSQESIPSSLSGLARDPDASIELSSHVRRLSISSRGGEPEDLFLASQSPIQPKSTYDSSDDELSPLSGDEASVRRSHWSRHHACPRQSDITIDTIDSYARKPNGGRAMREVPVGIKLAPGATFHLEKLPVKRTETLHAKKESKGRSKGSRVKRFINFPDPLVRYSKRHRRVLREIFAWISDSEKESGGEDSGAPSRCVIFSLTEEKIIDLTLKVLLADAAMDDSRRHPESDPLFKGKTIIVARTKDELSKWESALREGTGCSVLNHATLLLSERVRSSTAEKAVRYDVVLTTYEALKSPDVAIQVDDMGYAVAKQAAPTGGEWFSSTTTDDAPRMCKQLSVLHRITFQRIIFTDELGRKSFLAKPGTTRAIAFTALRADSRLVFFSALEDYSEIPPLQALKKSDKRAISALLALLRLSGQDHDEKEVLEECVCDAEDMYEG